MAKRKHISIPSSFGGGIKLSREAKDINSRPPVFSFKFFHGDCQGDGRTFNNFYKNDHEAATAVGDFFEYISEASKHTIVELFRGKKHYKCHPIKETDKIRLIEHILEKIYNLPIDAIDNFEQEYIQIGAGGDGGRMICYKNESIFYILFIDSNHFIYRDASRRLNEKLKYSMPGYFYGADINGRKTDHERIDLLGSLYENGKNLDRDGLLKEIKEILDYSG